jgi:armadillo repeat-containing protein 8
MPASLLSATSQLHAETPSRLRVALGRALRTFMCSLADCSGPQRCGILPSVDIHLRKEAQAALDDFLQPISLDVWIPFLQDSSLYPLLCTTIASSIRTTAHRNAVCDWLPPAERAKASKGKRGWEKRPSVTSPTTSSSAIPFSPLVAPSHSWVLRHLLLAVTTQGGSASKIAVSLEALAALCKDNPSACAFLRIDGSVAPVTPGGETSSSTTSHMQSLLLLQRSSNPEIRITANEL